MPHPDATASRPVAPGRARRVLRAAWRWTRRLLLFALTLVTVVVLLLAVVTGTGAGRERLRRTLVWAVPKVLPDVRLALGHIGRLGPTGLLLVDLTVRGRAKGGTEVELLHVDRIEVRLSPRRIWRGFRRERVLPVDAVEVVGLRAAGRTGPEGFVLCTHLPRRERPRDCVNPLALLLPSKPKPPEEPSEPPDLGVRLERLLLTASATLSLDESTPPLAIERLVLEANAELGRGGSARAALKLAIDGVKLAARAGYTSAPSPKRPRVDLRLDLDAPHADLVRLTAPFKLRPASGLALRLGAAGPLDALGLDLDLRLRDPAGATERGRVAFKGTLRPDPLGAQVELTVAGLDPSHVLVDLPPALANLTLKAEAEGLWPKMRGKVDLALGEIRYQKLHLLRGRVRGGLQDDRVKLEELTLELPGGRLGLAGQSDVAAQGPIDARVKIDLAQLRRLPYVPKSLDGAIDVHAALRGTLKSPRAELKVRGRRLAFSGMRVARLSLDATAHGPLEAPGAKLTLNASGLVLPGRNAERLSLTASVRPAGEGRHQASVQLAYVESARGRVDLDLGARLALAEKRIDLQTLGLGLPGYRLELSRPARIALSGPKGREQLRIAGLELRRRDAAAAGHEAIRVDARLGPGAAGEGQVALEGLDMGALARAAGTLLPAGAIPKLGARLDLDLKLRRQPHARRDRRVDVKLRTRLAGIRFAKRKLESLALDLALGARSLQLDVASSDDLGLTVKGALPIDGDALARGQLRFGPSPLALEVALRRAAFAKLARLDPALAELGKLPGNVAAKVILGGDWKSPELRVEVDLDELEAAGLKQLAAKLRLKLGREGLSVQVDGQHAGAKLLAVDALARQDGAALLRGLVAGRVPDVQKLLRTTPVVVKVRLEGVRAKNLPPALFAHDPGKTPAAAATPTTIAQASASAKAPEPPPLRLGRLDVAIDVEGTPLAPRAGVAVGVRGLGVTQGQEVLIEGVDTDLRVRFDGPARRADVDAQVDWQRRRLLTVAGELDGPDQLPLGKALLSPKSRVRLIVELAQSELARFARLVPALAELKGIARLRLKALGTLADPQLQAEVHLRQLRPRRGTTPIIKRDKKGKPYYAYIKHPKLDLDGTVAVSQRELKLTFIGSQRSRAGKGRLSLVARAHGFDLERRSFGGLQFDGQLQTSKLDISLARAFVSELGETGGRLDADVRFRGTPKQPLITARLGLEDGTVAYIPIGQTYRHVTLQATLTPYRFTLGKAHLQNGDGHLEVSGYAELKDLRPTKVHLDIDAKRFAAAVAATEAGAIVDATARLTASLAPSHIDGQFEVTRAHVRVPDKSGRDLQKLDRMEKVVFRKQDKPLGLRLRRRKKKNQAPLAVRIQVSIPRHFRVSSRELQAEIKADILAKVRGSRVSVEGAAEVISGRLHTLGKQFKIEQAKVTFPGGNPANPFLDVSATHQVREYLVRVRIQGPAKKPSLTLESEPDVGDQRAVLGLLLTGSPGFDNADTATAKAAASALSGYAASSLKQAIAPNAPIDVLKVDVGSDGQLASSRVEVGTYITDSIYVSYAHRFGAKPEENQHEAILEYRFKPRWSLEMRYGDAGAGGLDLTWTFRH